MLVVDVENEPCKYPADIIDKHHPGCGKLFVKNAMGLRGITAWVEREGSIGLQDKVEIHVPTQRSATIYRACALHAQHAEYTTTKCTGTGTAS